MALEAAAQLLASALMLLQAASANPSLPEATRIQAEATAQKAITEATRAIGKPHASGAPSCTIRSDKYTYYAGEVVVLDWTSANASKIEFVQNTGQPFPTPAGELLGAGGQYRKVITEKGYPFLSLKATGANGRSTTCSVMVHVY